MEGMFFPKNVSTKNSETKGWTIACSQLIFFLSFWSRETLLGLAKSICYPLFLFSKDKWISSETYLQRQLCFYKVLDCFTSLLQYWYISFDVQRCTGFITSLLSDGSIIFLVEAAFHCDYKYCNCSHFLALRFAELFLVLVQLVLVQLVLQRCVIQTLTSQFLPPQQCL